MDEQQLMQQLGKGIVLPVAYDTAWLARVPSVPDTSLPAYPQALDYLRQHQLPNGSWGSDILQAHGNTLSTLAAILALQEMGDANDAIRIQAGINALLPLAQQLANDYYETIGFEMLLPALLADCQRLKLQLPTALDEFYQPYIAMRDKKLGLILQYHEQYGTTKPASWWFNLEMLGFDNTHTSLQLDKNMLSKSGSVAASPAATAFLLSSLRYKGEDLPEAAKFLDHLVSLSEQGAALPNVFPIDEFEWSFAANYLLDAGCDVNNRLLAHLSERVLEQWNKREQGGLGYSSHFFIDPDCSANGLRALMLTQRGEALSPDVLLEFFNGECIETYAGELNPSVSTNIHCLLTLRLFADNAKAQLAIEKILAWLQTQAKENGPVFIDKWHASPVYPTARAVIALQGLDDELAQRCVDYLLATQREEGAWGEACATQEETAFAVLSLLYWQRHGHAVSEHAIAKARDFLLANPTTPKDTLWIGKTLYCPVHVISSLIYAAQQALSEKADGYGVIQYHLGEIEGVSSLQGTLARLCAEYQPADNSQLELSLQTRLQQHDLWNDKYARAVSSICLGSQLAFRDSSQSQLVLYTTFSALMLLLDDILDDHWKQINNNDVLSQLLLALFDHDASLPESVKLPDILLLKNAFNALFAEISLHEIDAQCFLQSLQATCQAWLREFNMRAMQLQLTRDEYLSIRAAGGALEPTIEMAYLLKKLSLPENLRSHWLYKQYINKACKALIVANDIFSYQKELKQDNPEENLMRILQRDNELSLLDAFARANALYNELVTELLQLQKQLLSDADLSCPDLDKALKIVAHHVQAHLEWALVTQRYRAVVS